MKEKLAQIILTLIILLNLLLITYNFQYKIVVIQGNSMMPTFILGDRIRCRKRPKNIQIGDIIGYKLDGVNIIHRVVEVNEYNGYKYYILKGDNNSTADFIPITKENIYCKVVE